MWAVWVVVGVLGAGAAAAVVGARRTGRGVDLTVREFADFREAIASQVNGVQAESGFTHRHADRRLGGR